MAIIAGGQDLDRVTEIITLAFVSDPVWGVAIARPDGSRQHHAAYWRPWIEGAMRNSAVYLNNDASAVTIWVPPGCTEMTDEQSAEVLSVVEKSLPPESKPLMIEIWDRFAAAQPPGSQHAYLSFLATHPDSRGHGFGQMLLRENLAEFDKQGVPTYLESTNPANNHRYERAGYTPLEGFFSPFDSAPITRMWRPAGRLEHES